MTTAFDTQLVSTFDLLSRMLRQGYSVLQAMETIAQRAPQPTSGAAAAYVAAQHAGQGSVQALDALRASVPSGHLGTLVDVMLRQYQEGGNLADKLDAALEPLRALVGRDGWADGVQEG